MNWTKIILIGGALAYPYIKTAMAFLKFEFSFAGVRLRNFGEKEITIGLILKADNQSRTNIKMEAIKADIVLNGVKVGNIANRYDFTIHAGRYELFEVIFDINKENAGDELWQLIKSNNTDIVLEIKGTAKANAKTYPLQIKYTTSSIIEMMNNEGGK